LLKYGVMTLTSELLVLVYNFPNTSLLCVHFLHLKISGFIRLLGSVRACVGKAALLNGVPMLAEIRAGDHCEEKL